MRRRLFWQIYLGFVAFALLCVAVGGIASLLRPERDEVPRTVRGIAGLIGEEIADRPGALHRLADELGLELGLFAPDGALLARTSDELDGPKATGFGEVVQWRTSGSSALVKLDDGNWLAAAAKPVGPRIGALLLWLGVAFLIMAAVAWPLARRVTSRLELLGREVAAWGAGDLAARARVAGRDEVAQLAEHFNAAAVRIEALVAREKRVLAHASHELRSPLARLRMGLELMLEAKDDEARRVRHEAAAADIAELDQLIGDVLLASRLEAGAVRRPDRPVALHTLVAAEAARAGVRAEVAEANVVGDEGLLVRLARNLIDNAVRHGGRREEVVVVLARDADGVRLTVDDRGPGVPEEYRETIFEPFFRLPGHAEGDAGGVGIGLSLVREIAALHGGRARVVAREEGGSRFEVWLP